MSKILLLEDDKSLAFGMKVAIENNGHSVTHITSIKDASDIVFHKSFDLFLFDVMLTDGDSFTFYNAIKDKIQTPVIFLSALDDEFNIVTGLNIGGDDYITKPFKLAELLSRINVVLRRAGSGKINIVESGDLRVDISSMKVYKGNNLVELTLTEFKLLKLFLENANTVISKEQIFYHVWDIDGNYVDENTLAVNIRRLRNKVEPDPGNPTLIKTIRGVGYIWDKRSVNGW